MVPRVNVKAGSIHGLVKRDIIFWFLLRHVGGYMGNSKEYVKHAKHLQVSNCRFEECSKHNNNYQLQSLPDWSVCVCVCVCICMCV